MCKNREKEVPNPKCAKIVRELNRKKAGKEDNARECGKVEEDI